jgi:hypothetical protein
MKRWREVAGFCVVLQDGIFVDDLADYNPFPGVSPALYLKADFFKTTRDEDKTTRNVKLTSRAVIRLPMEIAPSYIGALRLDERYPAGDAAIQSLEELKTRQGVPVRWRGRERAKLAFTKSRRDERTNCSAVENSNWRRKSTWSVSSLTGMATVVTTQWMV